MMKTVSNLVRDGILQTKNTAEGEVVILPAPQTTGGMPLFDALKARRTTREFSERAPDMQTLSTLLWAAQGLNRGEEHPDFRTTPTARHSNEINLYAVMEDAVYLYIPADHGLKLIHGGDLRGLMGSQEFVASVPLNLLMTADHSKQPEDMEDAHRRVSAFADAAFIGQSVYLACAALGMAAVFRGWIDRDAIHAALNLPPQEQAIYAQSVGYPQA